MRYFLIFFIWVTVSDPLHAQGIEFDPGFLPQVFEKAIESNKPVFVEVFATWCRPCHYLRDSVFTDSTLGAFTNQYFISTSLDAEVGEGVDFVKKYGITSFPTLMVFSPEGKVLGRKPGVMEAEQLKVWLSVTSSNLTGPTNKTSSRKRRKRR